MSQDMVHLQKFHCQQDRNYESNMRYNNVGQNVVYACKIHGLPKPQDYRFSPSSIDPFYSLLNPLKPLFLATLACYFRRYGLCEIPHLDEINVVEEDTVQRRPPVDTESGAPECGQQGAQHDS